MEKATIIDKDGVGSNSLQTSCLYSQSSNGKKLLEEGHQNWETISYSFFVILRCNH